MENILIGGAAIRRAVWEIMRLPDVRKVVVVAFVGIGAEQYILRRGLNATRLKIICWDKEGCTSPEAIRTLQERGAKVHFAKNLHMKLYWAEGRGAVIGSANLSNNGLGDNGLAELAVRVKADEIDIRAILKDIESRSVNDALLADLFQRTAEYRRRNNGADVFEAHSKPKILFEDWLKRRQPSWKFFAYREYFDSDPVAPVQQAGISFADVEDYWSGVQWHTAVSEWSLQVDMNDGDIQWAMADHQIRMKRNDPHREPPAETHYAVQITKKPGIPPFKITKKFREAVKQFVESEKLMTYKDCTRYTKANQGALTDKQVRILSDIYHGL